MNLVVSIGPWKDERQQSGKTMFAMFTEQRLLNAGAPAK
jgi:hypothetical protein